MRGNIDIMAGLDIFRRRFWIILLVRHSYRFVPLVDGGLSVLGRMRDLVDGSICHVFHADVGLFTRRHRIDGWHVF